MGMLRLLLATSVFLGHIYGTQDHLIGGALAVEAFFVISGFYIEMILGGVYQSNRAAFWVSRALRIFPAYWLVAGLTVAASTLWIGSETFGRGALEYLRAVNVLILGQDTLFFAREQNGAIVPSPRFWLPGVQPFQFLIVPQAWSLALELYFYLLAPWLTKLRTLTLAVIATLLLGAKVGVLTTLSPEQWDPWAYRFFPFELPLFMAGMLGFRFYRSHTLRWAWVPAFSVFPIIAAYRLLPFEAIGAFRLFDLPLLLLIALSVPFVFAAFAKNRLDRLVGETSYPFYLLHTLVLQRLEGFLSWGVLGLWFATFAAALAMTVLIDLPLNRWRHSIASSLMADRNNEAPQDRA